MNRRHLLTTTLAAFTLPLAVAACNTGSTVTPGQIIADAQAALQGLKNVLPALSGGAAPVLTPALAAELMADVTDAIAVLASIGPGTPAQTGATVLASVSGYLNGILSVLGSLQLPAPFNVVVAAVAVIAPEIIAYIQSVTAASVPVVAAARRAATMGRGMSLEKARQVLAPFK